MVETSHSAKHEQSHKTRRYIAGYLNQLYHSVHSNSCTKLKSLDLKTLSSVENATIGILGGGMAGLHTALMLENLKLTNPEYKDLTYQIIERNDHVGGRIMTHHYSPKGEWNYSDMGAMRLPANNAPVYDLIDYVNKLISEKNKTTVEEPYP